jgi:D-glycero-alpha-D-manno-heptose 1-phosphate guanylyltransferase
MQTKEAIVLAGGLGLRLRDVLPDTPKCMAPVNNLPFLTYVFDYLEDQQIHKVILSVGYCKEQIINYFGNKYNSLEIVYAIENEPLGTGGALKLASTFCSQNQVFVINGDTYFIPELEPLEKIHFDTSADVTISVKKLKETARYGLVSINQAGRITEFKEKEIGSGEGWINGGIYLINRKLIGNFNSQKFSLENDLFKKYTSVINMQAFKTDSFFLDIGIPSDYAKAQTLISSKRKP